ncbi:OTU domain-containing protein [Canna indica]|uniref:OTU domain-containing protein n=1 Tax=Canna indica TaxID=4628 RepID=A0AAQ3KSM1_9LILI|nr:OTU domain-containing protein [Canna indica]
MECGIRWIFVEKDVSIYSADSSFYVTSYVGEVDIGTPCATIENDEIITHALQVEELSQLAVFEASGSAGGEEECLQVFVLTQYWFSPYTISYNSGPTIYGCLYCPLSYEETLTTLNSSKNLKDPHHCPLSFLFS